MSSHIDVLDAADADEWSRFVASSRSPRRGWRSVWVPVVVIALLVSAAFAVLFAGERQSPPAPGGRTPGAVGWQAPGPPDGVTP